MSWKRVRQACLVVLGGGMVFQVAGCETLISSVLSNVVSSYITEAVRSYLLKY